MLKYISLGTLFLCSALNFISAQQHLSEFAASHPTIDLVKTLNSAIYYGDKHSPNKSAYTYKLFSKVMNGKATQSIFNTHMEQIKFQLSFVNYDYILVDKKVFFENLKTRLLKHPNAKELGEIITFMIAQLESFYATLPAQEKVALKDIVVGLPLHMDREAILGSFTGEFFWFFLNTAYNPFEHIKVLIDKEIANLATMPSETKSENPYATYYWNIENLYTESKGKHLGIEFFLTYMEDKIKTSKIEAEKNIYIAVTQEVIRAIKNEYYIPEFYLEKMQSALHNYLKKENFAKAMESVSDKKLFSSWIQQIEKGFSLALLPFSFMKEKFTVVVNTKDNTPIIQLKAKAHTFVHNSAIRAHTYDIELLNHEIMLNDKPYTVELMNYAGIESAINNRRSLLIYPKGQDKKVFIQLNLLFATEHYKIEAFKVEAKLINIDLVKNLSTIDKDLYELTDNIQVGMGI